MSDMTVGSIQTTQTPPIVGGIYEVLLSKAERERDHYKTSLETLFKSINDWSGSMVKEPADDFIAAIAAFIEAKLNP